MGFDIENQGKSVQLLDSPRLHKKGDSHRALSDGVYRRVFTAHGECLQRAKTDSLEQMSARAAACRGRLR